MTAEPVLLLDELLAGWDETDSWLAAEAVWHESGLLVAPFDVAA